MFIEIPYKSGDAITFKTVSGDEVVARYVEDDTDFLTVEKPLAVMATPQGIGLGPFSFTVNPDSKFKVNKSTLVFYQKTDEEMAKQYIQSTSGIAL